MPELHTVARRNSKPANDTYSGFSDQSIKSKWLNHLNLILSAAPFVGNRLGFSVLENALQMAAAKQSGLKQKILNLTTIYIPASLHTTEERQLFIAGHIEDYIREFGGKRPVINITVAGAETAFRNVTLPIMKKRELNSAIEFEARRKLPFPVDDCHFDYRSMRMSGVDDPPVHKLALVAATNRLISEALEPFEQLNVDVHQIYHTREVVGHLLRRLPDFSENKGYSLISVEHNGSEVSFYRGSNLEFSHIISLGTSFLSDRHDTTVFEYFAESLATEIQNSLDYYAGQFSNVYGNQILVYGDLSYSDELVSFLGTKFGITFTRFPTDSLDVEYTEKSGVKESFPVCLSAASAAIHPPGLANLLPRLQKNRIRKKQIDRYAVSSLIILTMVLISGLFYQRSQLSAVDRQLTDIVRQVETFKNAKLFDTYSLLKRRIDSDEQYLELTRKTPSYMGLNLKELSRLTPRSIRLYHFDYSNIENKQNLAIFGVVSSRNTPPELILAEYIENLAGSPFYDNVVVKRHSKRMINKHFELDFHLGMQGAL